MNKLSVGDKAPDFKVKDALGNTVSLSAYKHQPVLLVFLRYSGCPWCNLAIHRLSLEHSLFQENNCQVIAFVQSSRADIVTNIYGRHKFTLPFPVVPDPNRLINNKYGISRSLGAAVRSITKLPSWVHAVTDHGFRQTKLDGSFFLVPAVFLLAKGSHSIVKAHYGTTFYDHDSFLDFHEALIFKGA